MGLGPPNCCPGCGNPRITFDSMGNVVCIHCRSKWYVRELIPLQILRRETQ